MIKVEIMTEAHMDEIEIRLDTSGLDDLMAQLTMLRTHQTDHIHLMSPNWGGSHLDTNGSELGRRVVNHVKITIE